MAKKKGLEPVKEEPSALLTFGYTDGLTLVMNPIASAIR
jgi:hypothetical protein